MGPSSTSLLVSTAAVTAVGGWMLLTWKNHMHQRHESERRRQRAQRVDEEREKDEHEEETFPSILEHFRELNLGNDCTIDEANKRRTVKYYELARDAHVYDLCVGVRSYTRLRNRREAELGRIMKYHAYNQRHGAHQRKSHRTVMVMVDDFTGRLLHQAREKILEPLNYTSDITTSSRVWIPEESIIPMRDMHVTVAIPWWWHTVREGNQQLSEELVARFRQALVMEFHHPFQLELERIVLLGGKTLMALWRCVGERKTIDGDVIHDRHGEGPDPFVKLRRDIVRCFTATDEFESFGKEPLTYAHRFQQHEQPQSSERSTTPTQTTTATATLPRRGTLKRENSIELKTPGLSDHDGFIHTTLARLPLNCLSTNDVELAPIHRLCREATATYCGHRLVVNKFRFVETVGAGGESNPCINPTFDETIAAPPRFEVDLTTGGVSENTAFTRNVERHVTIGATPVPVDRQTTMDDLFLPIVNKKLSPALTANGRPSRRTHSMDDTKK